MIVDYHMHLRNGSEEIVHDTWAVDPFVDAARAAGVDEIGFTEHGYYFKQTRSLWTVPYMTERCVHDIELYVEAIVTAQDVEGRSTLRTRCVDTGPDGDPNPGMILADVSFSRAAPPPPD